MNIEAALPILSQKISDEVIPTIDLRSVHSWLGVKTQYSKWVQRRIVEYSFVQDVDFIVVKNDYLDSKGVSRVISLEYHATLDMAKQLCMVEKGDKGNETRKYFIACEKKARKTHISSLPPFMQRAMLNRPALKDGYFSVIDEVSDKIIAGLEQLGATFPEKFCPDISVGLFWAKYLRDTNRNPGGVGAIKYVHLYQDGRQVDAWQYPEVMFSEFQTWLRSKWMVNSMPKYFNGKNKTLMPLAYKGIEKHFLPIPVVDCALLGIK